MTAFLCGVGTFHGAPVGRSLICHARKSGVVRRIGPLRMASTTEVGEQVVDVPQVENPGPELVFKPMTNPLGKIARTLRFFLSLRGRIKKGSVLSITIGGPLPDQRPMGGFLMRPPEAASLPEVTANLRNAAHDPRIASVYMKIEPIACGYAKLEEIRRYMDYFRQSGKKIVAYMQLGGEKEYFLTLSADEVYVPPEAFLSLRGFRVGGSFVRGVLDKIGVEPQVQRIGAYKSAGDQLARTSMSAEQREVLEVLLKQQHSKFIAEVSAVKGVSKEEVDDLLNRAPQEMNVLKEEGWVTDVLYESEVLDMLKSRHNMAATEERKLKRPLRSVTSRRYSRVRGKTLGLEGKTVIAVIRAGGAITLGKSGSNPATGSTVGSDSLVELIRDAMNADFIKAVILRIDSPGGVSLASDIVWKELKKLSEKKPVIASMVDVAASGGYYLAMGCDKIVAEDSTLTGSIGVVTTKLSLKDLYERIGFVRENLSIGKYAEFDVDNRPFTEQEAEYFEQGAQLAYKSFVTKAAESRGQPFDKLNALAQGRVWTGRQAKEHGLVDEIGGLARAVELAKEKAEIKDAGRLIELRSRRGLPGILGLLRSAGLVETEASGMTLAEATRPQVLLMSDFDGTDTSFVQRFVAGNLVQAFVNVAADSNLREMLTRIIMSRER